MPVRSPIRKLTFVAMLGTVALCVTALSARAAGFELP